MSKIVQKIPYAAELLAKGGDVIWYIGVPNGQPHRLLETEKHYYLVWTPSGYCDAVIEKIPKAEVL